MKRLCTADQSFSLLFCERLLSPAEYGPWTVFADWPVCVLMSVWWQIDGVWGCALRLTDVFVSEGAKTLIRGHAHPLPLTHWWIWWWHQLGRCIVLVSCTFPLPAHWAGHFTLCHVCMWWNKWIVNIYWRWMQREALTRCLWAANLSSLLIVSRWYPDPQCDWTRMIGNQLFFSHIFNM